MCLPFCYLKIDFIKPKLLIYLNIGLLHCGNFIDYFLIFKYMITTRKITIRMFSQVQNLVMRNK